MGTLILETRKHCKGKLLVSVFGVAFVEAVWLTRVIMVLASRSPQGVQAPKTFSLYNYMSIQWSLLGPTITFFAPRIAGVNQEGYMGQVFRAPGESSRRQFVTGLALFAGLGTPISMIMLISAVLVGMQAGLLDSPSYAAAFWLIAALTTVNIFAINAVQLALSNPFDGSSVEVIIDAARTLIMSLAGITLKMSVTGWLLPWGPLVAGSSPKALTLGNPAGVDFVLVSNPWLLVTLATAVALAQALVSTRLITHKEESA